VSFKSNLKFLNLKISKLLLLNKPLQQYTSPTNINKNGIFNVPLNIVLFNNLKNRMLADFYIPMISKDMKIAVQKNHLWGQILYRILDPPKKQRQRDSLPKNRNLGRNFKEGFMNIHEVRKFQK